MHAVQFSISWKICVAHTREEGASDLELGRGFSSTAFNWLVTIKPNYGRKSEDLIKILLKIPNLQ